MDVHILISVFAYCLSLTRVKAKSLFGKESCTREEYWDVGQSMCMPCGGICGTPDSELRRACSKKCPEYARSIGMEFPASEPEIKPLPKPILPPLKKNITNPIIIIPYDQSKDLLDQYDFQPGIPIYVIENYTPEKSQNESKCERKCRQRCAKKNRRAGKGKRRGRKRENKRNRNKNRQE